MKKIIAIIMAVMLVMCMASAYAYNWKDVQTENCAEYNLTATKYVKVESDVGTAYEENSYATAKVGDIVYFSLSAVDTKGEEVEAETEYHNIGDIEAVGATLFKGKVVGSKPYVKISITEKTPVDELIYKGMPIIVEDDIVMIGDVVFYRTDDGTVVDVQHFENANVLLKDLAELGINLPDIYDGKIMMTDDILIANFGKVCKTEAVAAWYEADEDFAMGIPKTGDYTVSGIIILAICLLAITAFSLAAKKAKR